MRDRKDIGAAETIRRSLRKEITKYFDRIHDKVFTLNNIYIAGYLVLTALKSGTSKWIALVPLLNFCFLIYIDWRMMEASRMQSNWMSLTDKERKQAGAILDSTNILSLLTIISTFVVTVILFAVFYWS